jgi:hypothetical protein
VDECEENPRICNGGQCNNTIGSFLCSCSGGLLKGDDGSSCLGNQSKPYHRTQLFCWLFSNKTGLYNIVYVFAKILTNVTRRTCAETVSVVILSGLLRADAKKGIRPNWMPVLLAPTKTNARWVPIGAM